jgi:acyl-CoA thioester hydrolase
MSRKLPNVKFGIRDFSLIHFGRESAGSKQVGIYGPHVRLFEALRQTTQVRVRYADTDAAGIVHYAKYLAYLEAARAEALRAVGLDRESVAAFSLKAPVQEARLQYRSPARFDELLDVTAWVTNVSETQCRWQYEVLRHADSSVVVIAETDHRWSDSSRASESSSTQLEVSRALAQLDDARPG